MGRDKCIFDYIEEFYAERVTDANSGLHFCGEKEKEDNYRI